MPKKTKLVRREQMRYMKTMIPMKSRKKAMRREYQRAQALCELTETGFEAGHAGCFLRGCCRTRGKRSLCVIHGSQRGGKCKPESP